MNLNSLTNPIDLDQTGTATKQLGKFLKSGIMENIQIVNKEPLRETDHHQFLQMYIYIMYWIISLLSKAKDNVEAKPI